VGALFYFREQLPMHTKGRPEQMRFQGDEPQRGFQRQMRKSLSAALVKKYGLCLLPIAALIKSSLDPNY